MGALLARGPQLLLTSLALLRHLNAHMNLARSRELGIQRRLEPGFRGVTHYHTPRRRKVCDEAPVAESVAAASAGEQSRTSSEDGSCVEAVEGCEEAEEGEALEGLRAPALVDTLPSAPPETSVAPVVATLPHLLGDVSFALDLANWQQQLSPVLWPLPLQRMRLPGTHDSGAYALSRRHMAPSKLPRWLLRLNRRAWWLTRPFSGLVARWGEAQRLDVHAQLCAGARYLDLRIVNVQGTFHVAHGMLGATVDDVLAQLSRFLDEHPGEVVVADCNHFHHFRGKVDHLAFLALLTRVLGRHLAPREARRPCDVLRVPLGELVRAGTRCLLLHGGCDFLGVAAAAVTAGCWPRTEREVVSPWPRASSLPELRARLLALDAASRRAPGLFVLQGVVTPCARLVRRGLMGRPNSLRQLAQTVTPEVARMVTSGALSASCVVLLDHIELADVAQMLLSAYAPHLSAQRATEQPPEAELLEADEDACSDDEETEWLDGALSLSEGTPLLAKLSEMADALQQTQLGSDLVPEDAGADDV